MRNVVKRVDNNRNADKEERNGEKKGIYHREEVVFYDHERRTGTFYEVRSPPEGCPLISTGELEVNRVELSRFS
jgi:hypothetical protein